ncbi:hypothetical protein ENBRE01_0681 [Enteropsectra breve]|nr:hypothetical protein ENBRE01_0681 [Enteropsectra breve]
MEEEKKPADSDTWETIILMNDPTNNSPQMQMLRQFKAHRDKRAKQLPIYKKFYPLVTYKCRSCKEKHLDPHKTGCCDCPETVRRQIMVFPPLDQSERMIDYTFPFFVKDKVIDRYGNGHVVIVRMLFKWIDIEEWEQMPIFKGDPNVRSLMPPVKPFQPGSELTEEDKKNRFYIQNSKGEILDISAEHFETWTCYRYPETQRVPLGKRSLKINFKNPAAWKNV